jgi:hypothetical protein
MRKEPKGLMATFVITKTYFVTVCGDDEEDVWCNAEALSNTDIDEDDFVDMEIRLKDGFEYDGF